MKRSEKTSSRAHRQYMTPATRGYTAFIISAFVSFVIFSGEAQVKQLIQVRTFDEQLQPMKNVEVSINGTDFISTGSKGVIFIELTEQELPVKTIKVKDEQFEAGAWNYSKSILEIVVRKRNYQSVQIFVRDRDNLSLADLPVTFMGKKTTSTTTNAEGKLEIPLALDEKINSAAQFAVTGYTVVRFQSSGNENILTVERPGPGRSSQTPVAANRTVTNEEFFRNFDLSKLDSIQSLTMFYSLFKTRDIKGMNDDIKEKLDAKFNALVAQLQDSMRQSENTFMGSISDSSFVGDDIRNLLNQVTVESQTLSIQRAEFDEKINLINEKLERGIINLDANARAGLLSDLIALETLLTENESRFYKNMNDYQETINTLKEKYFDFQNLENKLSESEARLLEEQRIFRQRLIGISAVVIIFAILIILLITFSSKLKKQKKALVLANAKVRHVNENLEAIVLDRTKLLEEANRELDTFLYRASHDLRSPVCSIIGLCNIALHLSGGETKELVQRVANTTEGMDKLLKKLSIISEINQPTGYSSITLLDMVEGVRHQFRKIIDEKCIEFLVDCPADLVFYSYPNLMEVVLTNLLENAFHYSVMQNPGHARVELKATINDDTISFSVFDNGTGIDETIHHRLFDMFFKGHEDSKGNGLGLYIVQKSVHALDGVITVESERGQFTRFVVQLPLNTVPMKAAVNPATV